MTTIMDTVTTTYNALVRYYFVHENSFDRERILHISIRPNNILEIVYRRPESEHLLGLRVRVIEEATDEAARIVADNLGEPLPAGQVLTVDSEGIHWWEGRPPALFYE